MKKKTRNKAAAVLRPIHPQHRDNKECVACLWLNMSQNAIDGIPFIMDRVS